MGSEHQEPEILTIENFWRFLKRNVYKDAWQAKNLDELKKYISKCIQNIDVKIVQKLTKGTIKRIDHVLRFGVR